MISSLYGKLEALAADWAIINVNGIGFQVRMPTSTLSNLGHIGGEVKVHTHMHVREDDISLFGFSTPDELALFESLTSVSGVGPKTALSLLSAMSVEQLTTAIATGSAEQLTAAPGIGKKLAGRLVMELKDKIGAGFVISTTTQVTQENADVLAALTSLGYSTAEAAKAVSNIPVSSKLTLEEKLKLALQSFGSK